MEDLRSEIPDADPAWLMAVSKNRDRAARTPRERAIWRYAQKLSLTPSKASAADLDKLRRVGLSDADLLDLVQVIAYFNYINRVADGLGVPDEPEWGSKPV